jgi:hypothetical protein
MSLREPLNSEQNMKLDFLTRSRLALALLVGAFLSCCNVSRASTLTNGLLFHLSFDTTNVDNSNGADGVFLDDSGNGDNGTNFGASIAKGFIGAGAVSCTTSLDGTVIDYVSLGYPTNLQFDSTESFSISFWTSFTNQGGDIPFISNKNWNSSDNQGWGIFTEPSSIRINVTDGSDDKQSTENSPDIKASGWHHVCVTFDRGAAGLVTLYVDGTNYPTSASDSLANVTGDIDTISVPLAVNIGQDGTGTYTDGGGGEVTNMLMDDMAAWSRVLSSSEVSAIYQGGLAGSNVLQVVTKLPPSIGGLTPGPGFVGASGNPILAATITDKDLAANPATVTLALDGTQVAATVNKTNGITQVDYEVTNLLAADSSHTVTLSFNDSNSPPDHITTNWSFVVLNYPAIPTTAAQPTGAVNTAAGNVGFQMRVSQISDQAIETAVGGGYGYLAASVDRAEAQLAGVLVDPMTGALQVETATPGPLPNGAYSIGTVVDFSYSGNQQGDTFTNYTEQTIPGLAATDDANLAVEIVTYLYLTAGFHQFGMNAADGFRITIGTNAYDSFSTQVGLYDTRSIPLDTLFGFAVPQTGYYATRIVWFRTGSLPDNSGSAGLQFYSIAPSGGKILINDSTTPGYVPAYQTNSAPYGPYVSYAGPTAFLSTYSGDDWGSPSVQLKIHDGSSAAVTESSVKLSVDGSPVSATVTNSAGVTTVSYTPPGLQLKRTIHTGQISYSAGGTNYSNTWQFDKLRNYVLPDPTNALSFENFDELADGQLPPGWVQTNYTTPEETTATTNFTDYNSDAFLGWTVLNTTDGQWGDWGQHLNVGLYQELNGKFFDATTNALLNDQFLYCESDNRSDQQIQWVYTKKYDFSGKTGIVVAFNSGYEQNQNNIDGMEYSLDGVSWQPLLYLVMGESDSQGPSMIVHDANGNLNVAETMAFSINPRYTNSFGKVIGGSIGAFVGPPITQALAPYIEGRVNDDSYESKRFEAYAVPGADNQASVQFRLFQAGTGSWYWGIDNWGIYSVPSIVQANLGLLTAQLSGQNVVLTWTAAGNVAVQQNSNLSSTNWVTVAGSLGAGTVTITNVPSKPSTFYRLATQ